MDERLILGRTAGLAALSGVRMKMGIRRVCTLNGRGHERRGEA
jgi:hypothetical protein